jgi:hypothetical protein
MFLRVWTNATLSRSRLPGVRHEVSLWCVLGCVQPGATIAIAVNFTGATEAN